MALRHQVLQSFKILHRTRQHVFNGDLVALEACRLKINEEYKKFKNVSNQPAIEELLKYADEVERELRTTVIQAKEVAPGKYEAKIGDDIVKLDNVPFKACTGPS